MFARFIVSDATKWYVVRPMPSKKPLTAWVIDIDTNANRRQCVYDSAMARTSGDGMSFARTTGMRKYAATHVSKPPTSVNHTALERTAPAE